MDKLTLEHLVPYLPYDTPIMPLYRSMSMGLGYNETILSIDVLHYFQIEDIKPILRPMSDFDKMDNEFDLTTDFETAYLTNATDIAFINTSDKTYLSDIKTVNKFIFENHLDVFGLIDKGLAVDINQIDNLNLSNN